MKNSLFVLATMLFCGTFGASSQTALSVKVGTPGTLESLIKAANPDYLTDVSSLTVTGTLNGNDLATLRKMSGSEDDEENDVFVGAVKELDLSEAKMVKGGSPYYSEYNFNAGGMVDYMAKDDSLGRYTFYQCHRLQKVVLPKTVRDLGNDVFSFCNNLKEIAFPDRIDTLRSGLFSNCTSLRTVIIPASVKHIGEWVFSFCRYLKTVICLGSEPASVFYDNDTENAFDHMDVAYTKVHVPDGTAAAYRKVPGWNQFKIMEYAPDVQLGAHLDSITVTLDRAGGLDSAFYRHYPDQERTVKYLKIIGPVNGDDVFMMRNMTTVGSTSELDLSEARIVRGGKPYHSDYNGNYFTANDSITERMFLICQEMTKITLPSNVKFIKGTNAFNGNLRDICINSSNERYEVNMNSLYDKQAKTLVFCPKGILDKNVVVAEGTEMIGDSAFYYFNKLESVKFPASLRQIGKSAFYYTDSLKCVEIPEGVMTIADDAFAYSGILQLDLPSTLQSLGKRSFNCSYLTEIRVKALVPPVASGDTWTGTFSNVDKNKCALHVPDGTLELYKQAEAWKDFTNMNADLVVSGIETIEHSQVVPCAEYGLDGRKVCPDEKGIHIIRYSDGSTKKVLVK